MTEPVLPEVGEPPEARVAPERPQPTGALDDPRVTRGIDTKGLSLRAFAARGLLVNTAFDLGLTALGLIRGFAIAAFLTRADYGIWGILLVSLGVLARLKVVGIADKYVQQQDEDQELAFQKAFTMELLVSLSLMLLIAALLPVIAIVYGHWSLLAPGAVLLTVVLANALQAPLWVYLRQMDFVRQRLLAAAEPIVTFVVSLALAIAGAGYWSLAVGVVLGAWSGALVAILYSPYPLKWRYDKGALQVYTKFSGPIFVATLCSVVLANSTVLAANAHLGLAAVGVVALAGNITVFTNRIDDLVGGTLYPAICAIQNRLDLLRESFIKTNRLALMWAMPFGFAIALFAADLVQFVIGSKWGPAVRMLQITGVVAAVGQIGWNWDDYLRARDNTMPLAIAGVAATIAFLAVGLPLLFTHGLTGLAIGIAVQVAVHVVLRAWYLRRLFEGFGFLRHAVRAVLPSIPAVAFVLLARTLESGKRTLAEAIGELVVYALVTVLATWIFEGTLVREAIGYLIERSPRAAASAG